MVPHKRGFPRVFIITPDFTIPTPILPTQFTPMLMHYGTRYLPRSVRFVARNGTSPRCGPVRVNAGPQSCQFIRRMSSSPTKHLFFVYAPDYASPGMLDHRFSVREKHLKGVDGLLESGTMSACDVQLRSAAVRRAACHPSL